MKTLIILIATSLILFSCTKEETTKLLSENSPTYYGEYHSSKGDTATVSGSGNFIYIRFAPKNPSAGRFTMDSIRLNSDMTFLCNEYMKIEDINGRSFDVETIVGTGKIGSGVIDFTVTRHSSSTITYSGVKK